MRNRVKTVNITISLTRKIMGQVTNIIEKIWNYMHLRIDTPLTVPLVGSPRSGTTWVMEIIETLGNYRVIFEPFHIGIYPISRKFIWRFLNDPVYRITYRPYLPRYHEDKNLEKYLSMVLKGRISGYWFSPPTRLVKNLRWIKAEKVLIKDVWIPRLLPWITYRFRHEIKRSFLLIRHPCAVIESQIRTCIGNPLCRYSKHIVKKVILKQLDAIEELKDVADDVRSKLMNVDKSEELLAAIWSMDYFVPLYYNTRNLYIVIAYEDLVLHPNRAIKTLIQLLELSNSGNSDKLSKFIVSPAPTAKDVANIVLDNVYKWRKRLSKQQIESILRITHAFNLTFYDKNIEPDYNTLKNWKL